MLTLVCQLLLCTVYFYFHKAYGSCRVLKFTTTEHVPPPTSLYYIIYPATEVIIQTSLHNRSNSSPFSHISTLLSSLNTKSIFSIKWSNTSMVKKSACRSSKLFELLSLDIEYPDQLCVLERYGLSRPFSILTRVSIVLSLLSSVQSRQSTVVPRLSIAVISPSPASLSVQSNVTSLLSVELSSGEATMGGVPHVSLQVFTSWSKPSVSYGIDRNW